MGRHSPGEGMTPVAELIGLSEGATEEYADELHAMNEEPTVNEEARA